MKQSVRAQVIERRTYLRPLDKDGTIFETPEQSWDRVIGHQRWLWERAQGSALSAEQEAELAELRQLFLDRKVTVSGRTRWLGGTDIAKERQASQFNCSFGVVQTVHDVVDTIWLLLQGCFVAGTLVKMADGGYKPIEEVREGDVVLSYNEETREFESQPVQRLNINQPKPLVRVTLSNGEQITCTEDHLFLTTDGEWVEAKNISGKEVVHATR